MAKLISVGIDEDIFDHITAISEAEEVFPMTVHNFEGAFINALLRKALGVGSDPIAFALDPLVESVLDDMDELAGRHDAETCPDCG